MREKEIFSYVVKEDAGLAPNPWWGECTLAVCKPVIRKTANIGDWVVGLTPASLGNRLVYAMIVEETFPFAEYFRNTRFELKKPDFGSDDVRLWMGDNFYEETSHGFVQHISAHNYLGRDIQILKEKQRSALSGVNVLVSGVFFYYGKDSPKLSSRLDFLKIGRGHRLSGVEGVLAFEKHAAGIIKTPGIYGEPRDLYKESEKLRHLS